jgi:hypothetical protein
MSEPTLPSPTDEDARRQRREVLRNLAQSQFGSPATTPGSTTAASRQDPEPGRPLTNSVRFRRPWVIIVSTVLVLVVIAGVILHQLAMSPGRGAPSRPVFTSVVIIPSLHGLDCLQDAEWSPDGQQIALLGYGGECPSDDPSSYNYQPGVLQIYSAATGQMIHTLLPDASVLTLPGIPPAPSPVQPAGGSAITNKPVLDYSHFQWSPDGKQLALTFVILRWNSADTDAVPVDEGLVLVNADGTHERAALQNEASHQYAAVRWDTTTLTSLGLAGQKLYGSLLSLPPGTSYAWSSDGKVVPNGSLSAAATPTAPVGNPDGGRSFTIWQPGILHLFQEPGDPYIYFSYTAFLAWSPDGRYLIDSVLLRGIDHPAGEPIPPAFELHEAFGQLTAPIVPVRDPAEQRLYVSLTASANQGNSALEDIAWSPNGRLLAAIPDEIPSNGTSGSTTSFPVTLYDCASGKILGTLQPAPIAQAPASEGSATLDLSSSSLIRWSATGSHVLLYSDQQDTITIWGPKVLPHSASAAR